MKKRHLEELVYLLVLLIPFVISCTGQDNSRFQKDKHIESKTNGDQYEKIFKSQPTRNGSAENVHCGLKDKAGNLWFGTTGHGVFKFDGKLFTNYTKQDGLGSNSVWTICEDNAGNILIGTGKGISVYDGKSISAFAKYEELATSIISQLYTDKKGQIWIGTGNRGVLISDGKKMTNLFSNEAFENDFNLTLTSVKGMLEDKDGNIWFASWAPSDEGIARLQDNSIIRFTAKHGIKDSVIHCVLEDKSGMLWVGSRNNGVFSYDGNAFVHLAESNGPGKACIYEILEDKDGIIWFTTDGNGVYSYDGKIFKNYTIKDGLINNSVFSVVEDNDGNLWFGTRNVGLSRFDGKSFVNFSE